ncbi:helix-turn-helix domain-containing protein [Aequorivita sinensis]|uniref:helix-turn-helix domain-containing protein n=1 Tax=Aequorivita sinensis TaxID=1382458 RepID=UPI001124C051|nr:helix-turn-helix domain-containing protein [Aequorivita sinensis]
MENPFELINSRLERIEDLLQKIYKTSQNMVDSETPTKIMTVHTVSEYLNLSLSCIYKLTSGKEIPHFKRGKRLYFEKNEIDKWVMENKCLTNRDLNERANEYIFKNRNKSI